jgi:hypothetical protein
MLSGFISSITYLPFPFMPMSNSGANYSSNNKRIMKKNNFKQQQKSHTILRLKTIAVGFIVLGTVFTGCKPNAYLPNTIHTPLLKEKGEVRATINLSNLQLAYAITDHIGVMANGQYSTMSQSTTSGNIVDEDISKQMLGEIGVGYFKPLGEYAVFEVYGGGGYGNVSINTKSTGLVTGDFERTFTAPVSKIFIQPSIGLTNETFDIAFTPRLTGMNYGERKLDGFPTNEFDRDNILVSDGLYSLKGMHMFFEPGVTFRVGIKWVKFQIQGFYVGQISGEETTYIPVQIHLGIHANIAKRYSK